MSLRTIINVKSFVMLCLMAAPLTTRGQDAGDIRELKLRDWQPRSMLVTKTTTVERARFPAIDVHNHLGGGSDFLTPERVRHYLEEMDAAGVQTVVNLDGGWDKHLEETLAALDRAHPGRFLTFALINIRGHRRAGLDRSRAQAAGGGFQGWRQGAEDPQGPRPGPSRRQWPADPRR